MINEPRREPETMADRSHAADEMTFIHRMLITVGIVTAVVLVSLFLWYSVRVLLLVFAGILLAILLRALSDLLGSWARLPSKVSLLIACVGIIGVVFTAGVALTPRITDQVQNLQQSVPEAFQEVVDQIERHPFGELVVNETRDYASGDGITIASRARDVATMTLTAIGVVLLVLFVGLYLAISPRLYINGFVRLLPTNKRPRGREILHAVGYALKWWLIGRLIAMAFVGVFTAVGLWILGVPLALTLGLLAALLDFVPNIGPIIAAIPAVLIAFVESPTDALYVALLYFAVQQIESYVVQPLVQRRMVHLPPAITILAQVLFYLLVGPLGLLLATPLTVAAMEVIKGVYVHDVLDDRDVEMLGEKHESKEARREQPEAARQQA